MDTISSAKIAKSSKFSCIDEAIENLEGTVCRFRMLLDELAEEDSIQPSEKFKTTSFLSTYNNAAPRINEASNNLSSFLETLREMLV